MKFFSKFLILNLICTLLYADDFTKADNMLRQSVRIRELSAKTATTSAVELENLNRLCDSAKIHLAAINAQVASQKKQNQQVCEDSAYLLKSIETELKNLDELSAFLDNFYVSVLKQLPKDCSLLERYKADDIKEKTLPEKLRTTLALLEALKRADIEVVFKDNKISTGVFVKLSGDVSEDVSIFNVEGIQK